MNQDSHPNFYQTMQSLVLELIQTSSIVKTAGQFEIAQKIYEYLAQAPYFQRFPQHLRLLPVPQVSGANVIALVKGSQTRNTQGVQGTQTMGVQSLNSGASNRETVILIGHLDTVGIDDYGALKTYALQPFQLSQRLRDVRLSPEVEEDLQSGKYLFGRGSLDMKAGVAIQTVVTKRLSEEAGQFAGNVVLVLTPDEEGDSAGILAALPYLRELAAKEGLRYLGVINTDYTAPRFPGDDAFYVYWGAVGKLLPTFYVVGRETHVGEAFDGFDANLLSSELMRLIDMNVDLCDEAAGEVALPPVSLKQQDLKLEYTVQTPFAAVLYFNMATHAASPGVILERLRARAVTAFENVITYLNSQYRRYCDRIEHDYRPLPWKSQVFTYEDLYRQVRAVRGEVLDRSLDDLVQKLIRPEGRGDARTGGDGAGGIDERRLSLAIVEEVWRQSGLRGPGMVLFFSPPYYPHIGVPQWEPAGGVEEALRGGAARDAPAGDASFQYAQARFYGAADRMLQKTVQREQLRIEKRYFYPYISDMSFFGLSGRIPGTREFIANTPAWGRGYHLAIQENEGLLLPVVNIGPYGKDAHKMSERVLVDYSFRVVPEMVYGMLTEIFDEQQTGNKRGDR